MQKIKLNNLSRKHHEIRQELDEAWRAINISSNFILGDNLKRFEEEFAEYIGSRYCVGVGNGTDALELILETLNLPPGSEIIVPANTFFASAEAVVRCGFKVRFCDVCPDTLIASVDQLEEIITQHTSALIIVHLHGNVAAMDKIQDFCELNNLVLIEDCAQAHGGSFKGKKAGSFGRAAAFSFFPGKNIGAFGDAGCVTTDDLDICEILKKKRNHGSVVKFEHEFIGRNSRLDELNASILRIKLRYLDEWTIRKRKVAETYFTKLDGLGDIKCIKNVPNNVHAYHQFVISTGYRDKLRECLNDNQVETGIHYPITLPELDCFKYSQQQGKCINALFMAGRILSLPMDPFMEDHELERVIDLVNQFFMEI